MQSRERKGWHVSHTLPLAACCTAISAIRPRRKAPMYALPSYRVCDVIDNRNCSRRSRSTATAGGSASRLFRPISTSGTST